MAKHSAFEGAFGGLVADIQKGRDAAFANYLRALKAAWAEADPDTMDAQTVATAAMQLLSVCALMAPAANPLMMGHISPFMAAPASPFTGAPP
jgi:hypothetical protein